MVDEESICELVIREQYHSFVTSPEVLPAFRSPWMYKGRRHETFDYMVGVEGIIPIHRKHREKQPQVEYSDHLDHFDHLKFLLGETKSEALIEIGMSTFSTSIDNGMKYRISKVDDIRDSIKTMLRFSSGLFTSAIKQKEKNKEESEEPLRFIAHTNVLFGVCSNLNKLEQFFTDINAGTNTHFRVGRIRKMQIKKKTILVIGFQDFDSETISSEPAESPSFEVISDLGFDHSGVFAHTFLIVTKLHDDEFAKNLEHAAHAFFKLRISKLIFDALQYSNRRCLELLEDLPSIKTDEFKSISSVHNKLIEIHVDLSLLRRSQLLIHDWISRLRPRLEKDQKVLMEFAKVFDYHGFLKRGMNIYSILDFISTESSLEKRIESLEKAIQFRTEMTNSLIGAETEKQFGLVTIILGLLVVFEVLGTFWSWVYQSPNYESSFLVFVFWFLILISPILLVGYILSIIKR